MRQVEVYLTHRITRACFVSGRPGFVSEEFRNTENTSTRPNRVNLLKRTEKRRRRRENYCANRNHKLHKQIHNKS